MRGNFPEIIKACSSPLEPLETGLSPRLPDSRFRPQLKAVLFDVYGTLFISASGDIGQGGSITPLGLGDLCMRFGISDSAEQVLSRYRRGIAEEHRRSLETEGANSSDVFQPEVRVEEIWNELYHFQNMDAAMEFALRYECLVNPVYPMPSLGFVLEDVQNAGLSMGIVSNAQFFTPLLFNAFLGKGIKELGFAEELCVFSFLLGEAKPSARLFEIPRDILLDRGIDPESILYVGNDMLNDILCAKDAGFRTALFAGDSRSLRLREGDERVRGCEPDWIITSLDQLQAFI